MSDVAVAGIEAFPSIEANRDPFALYERLRAGGPVHRHPDRAEYLVVTDAAVRFVLRSPELFSCNIDGEFDPAQAVCPRPAAGDVALTTATLTRSDPPEHTVKRAPMRRIVERDQLDAYEPLIRQLVNARLDSFIDRGEAEFCATFANPLAFRLICSLLGLQPQEVEEFWTHGNPGTGHGARYLSSEAVHEQYERQQGAEDFLRDVLMDRLEHPGDDFLSMFVRDAVGRDGELRLDYLPREAALLLRAGNETTARLLANTMKLLLSYPNQMRAVRQDPASIPAVIEESLRLESPTQWISRRCVREAEIAGVTIPAGATVLAILASANRQESRWGETADAFCPGRAAAAGHLAFGHGAHVCLGAPLARLEGRLAFEILLQRLSDIRFHRAPPKATENIDNIQKRAPRQLWIEFDRAPA